MNSPTSSCPPSLRRYVEGEEPVNHRVCAVIGCGGFVLEGKYCARCAEELDALQAMEIRKRERQSLRPRLTTWTPTREQLSKLADVAALVGCVLDDLLKCAVILAAVYLVFEIGAAFLPSGTVERVLNGVR